MKLLAIFILRKDNDEDVTVLQQTLCLDSFGYFQRSPIASLLFFSAKTVIQRTDREVKQSIDLAKKVDGMIHAYVRWDGLACAVISDQDYPVRVAHNLLNKVIQDFTKVHPSTSWQTMSEGYGRLTSLNETLTKYQNPQEADPFMSLQKDLDETKGIMVKTLENALRRGEDIETLVARSEDLSAQTKYFYKQTKEMNRCCSLF